MHVKRFLHKLLSPVMHSKRLMTLILLVESAIQLKELSVVKLGRGISLTMPIQANSGIKRADRLIGNKHLHQERLAIYRELAKEIIKDDVPPWIVVDWSHVPHTTHHFLRAGIVNQGRTLTLWEEVYDECHQGNTEVHKDFLCMLKKILPSNSRAIIVTDAGFCNDWFKAVLKLGWDYVGRVRGRRCYQLVGEEAWHSYQALSKQKSCTVTYYGRGSLCKKNTLNTNFYFVKRRAKGRKSLNCHGKKRQGKSETEYRKANREPWLLVTSLEDKHVKKEHIVAIYQKRMQIEESFRDLKSSCYGLSLEHAYSREKARISVLLLIGTLASLVAHIVGLAAEASQLQYQFQTNSIKARRVLSLFYLGCEVIRKKIKIPIFRINMAIQEIGAYSC